MHPHTFLRTQIRNGLRIRYQNQGSTVFVLTSQKTEIAKSACEPKWQGLLTEDALGKLHLEQKSLVTWWRLITKSSTRDVNQETITGTLCWYKISPLSGFCLIRVKQRLHLRSKRVDESSWRRHANHKILKRTIHWNLGKHMKIINGINVLQHLIDPRQMALLKEPFDFSSIATSRIGCKMVGPFYGMLLLSAKHPRPPGRKLRMKDDLENHLKGPINRSGAIVEYHPILARDLWRIHQFGKKVLFRVFLVCKLIAGEIWKGRFRRFGRNRNISLKIQRERIIDKHKKEDELIFTVADGTAKFVRERLKVLRPTVRSDDFSRELQGEPGESQPTE